MASFFRTFNNICNRKAAIILALVDIVFGLVTLTFHCLRLEDLKEVNRSGHHLYYWVFVDSHYEFQAVNTKTVLFAYYKSTIGCSVLYVLISSILLFGAVAKSILACKIWLGTTMALFVTCMILYSLLFLRATSILVMLILTGFIYKVCEFFVAANFMRSIRQFAPTDIVANVEYGTLSKDANGDLQYTYSGTYMSISPLITVPQTTQQFDPNPINAYIYHDTFNSRGSASSSCIFLSQTSQQSMRQTSQQSMRQNVVQTANGPLQNGSSLINIVRKK